MLTEYRNTGDNVTSKSEFNPDRYDKRVVWIDALNPTPDELAGLSKIMGVDMPTMDKMTGIELSSRLYKYENSLVMIAALVPCFDDDILPPQPAAFILSRDTLVTVRYADYYCFDRVGAEVPLTIYHLQSSTILYRLLDEAVSDRADELEFLMRGMGELTAELFKIPGKSKRPAPHPPGLDHAMQIIGSSGEKLSIIRESMSSMQMLLNYARTYIPLEWAPDQAPILAAIQSDLSALSEEAAFFMNKLSFNLDTSLGMINIEENRIIRVLTIVTMLMAPPTLIAGIYGMNFAHMPELAWPFGYVFSLALMLGTGIVSVGYLKWKRWL